jgi:hypothetical protein
MSCPKLPRKSFLDTYGTVRGAGCVRFFDDEAPLATTYKMVDALNNEGVKHPLKRINLDSDLGD